ncbi:MAG: hypothetical protein V2I36_19230 [Desulfopila sp.]|jgi:hypothetical protein|nr:hypothetical protein [Desulfopila sp.]
MSQSHHTITLALPQENMVRLTTLLQSGIFLSCPTGTTIGVFLDSLPGFDMNYITERIQTIFFDGNAMDDLQRRFTQKKHVLALSAAMPGLAGAIFRKNSLCAALRTQENTHCSSISPETTTLICLKLFNMIAQEKGEKILQRGGLFTGESLKDFFLNRPSLLKSVSALQCDTQETVPAAFLSSLQDNQYYFFRIPQRNETGTNI